MTVLVTGAGGLVGAGLSALDGVHGLPRTTLDICDADAVARALDAYAPHTIINAAAFANVDGCERDPARAWRINAGGVDVLGQAARARGIRLVHLSTDYVLGGTEPRLSVDASPRPLGVYARSKLGGEQAAHAHGATVVRVQWVYRIAGSGFVGRALQQMALGQSVPLVVDQVGCPTPVGALASWLHALSALPELPPTLHLATRGSASAQEWVCALAEARSIPPCWHPIHRADLPGAPRPARSCLDVTQSERLLQRAFPDWREALRLESARADPR